MGQVLNQKTILASGAGGGPSPSWLQRGAGSSRLCRGADAGGGGGEGGWVSRRYLYHSVSPSYPHNARAKARFQAARRRRHFSSGPPAVPPGAGGAACRGGASEKLKFGSGVTTSSPGRRRLRRGS